MPKICHGQGNIQKDGCCYVNGQICVNRWKIADGHIYEGPNLIDLGTVDAYINSIIPNKPGRDRAKAQIQGVLFLCKAAIQVLIDTPALLNDRAGFDAAWASNPLYQPIADAWEAIGMPRNWCMTYGPADGQCCHAEDLSTNIAKQNIMDATAVSLRSRAAGVVQ
jgi:hypothetical protein